MNRQHFLELIAGLDDCLDGDENGLANSIADIMEAAFEEKQPKMFQQLVVDGQQVERRDLHRYAVRWTYDEQQQTVEAVLYRDGRRLTCPWYLNLAVGSNGGGDVSA